MDRRTLLLPATLIALLFAGCAAPEESGGDAGDGAGGGTPVTRDGDGLDNGTGGITAAVVIDGSVYTCDDTLSLGECDEYTLDEGAQASDQMPTATADADGRVTIDGRQYQCDDTLNVDVDTTESGVTGTTAGACEMYVLADE